MHLPETFLSLRLDDTSFVVATRLVGHSDILVFRLILPRV